MIRDYNARLGIYRRILEVVDEAGRNAPVCRDDLYGVVITCPEERPSWMGR